MTEDKPITMEDDKFKLRHKDDRLEVGFLLSDIQSAKRLLKWELLNAEAQLHLELLTDNLTEREKILYALIIDYCNKIAKIPDACFQIDDGKGKE